ncbi:STAS domain-containing protein [Mycobacterium deserti]|uniref:STAS domain-containing protein n=1 Tax=Mycobacterium deserti TaxID=2978347 RepID=A0ABT2M7Q2_9MYCO|nr:STAS domain-containing protein [Mycobacterium deserti]MCT7658293.1 STAS domain-containing protein [Mycobacterium deserti]
MSAEWADAAVVRVTVVGEIDASNAADLSDFVFRRAANCQRLVVDLRDVEFFSTAGFTELQGVAARCDRADVSLTLVGGPVVTRVLDLCDPGRTLPLNPA